MDGATKGTARLGEGASTNDLAVVDVLGGDALVYLPLRRRRRDPGGWQRSAGVANVGTDIPR